MKWILYSLAVIVIGALSMIIYLSVSGKNVYDLVLPLFNTVKKIKGGGVNLAELDNSDRPLVSHVQWSEMLATHVSVEGDVDYEAWQKDMPTLDSYLSAVSQNPPGGNWSDNEVMAYWINAYNAFTIKLVLDHYPLSSIKDISSGVPMINSPWDKQFFKIGGLDFDLNTIEHEILRKQFEESRIHFAVNCASISCPRLRNEAFTADRLESQLQDQAVYFINNPLKNQFTDGTNHLSAIFSWFESDFNRNQSVPDFVSQYTKQFIDGGTVKYLDYDWTLNDSK